MFGAVPPKPPIRAASYVPALPDGGALPTPEPKTTLYVGLGLAALVVLGGAYFMFVRES